MGDDGQLRRRRSSARPNTVGFGATVGGELEMSNVDLATEMTNMITAERGYQANSRMITTADQMLGTLVHDAVAASAVVTLLNQ